MEMFVSDDEVARLEAALPSQPSALDLPVLVALCWHLRQRDTERALKLTERAYHLLLHAHVPQARVLAYTARLRLVRAEAQCLLAETGTAETLIERAMFKFRLQDDHAGLADAFWLRGWIAVEQGDTLRQEQEWEDAIVAAKRASDSNRISFLEAELARFIILQRRSAALQRWDEPLRAALPGAAPAVASAIYHFLALSVSQSGDFAASIADLIKVHELAAQCGRRRAMIVALSNIADGFNNLNDYQAALEWGQRALDLARQTGWASIIGSCMIQLAEPLRRLGQFEAAGQMLQQALPHLQASSHSRNAAFALEYLGNLALDHQNYPLALDYFQQLDQRAGQLHQPDFRITAQRGLAEAHSGLGQATLACELARVALLLAQEQSSPTQQIRLLQILAAVHSQHALPPPPDMPTMPTTPGQAWPGHNAPLYYLEQAMRVAGRIEGYTVSGELLDALAAAHAASGDFASAYPISLQANLAREKTHSQEANNRAIAMQVRLHTERVLADGEYHRQLASSEARRAQVLQQTSNTLLHLSVIGQEITAQLNRETVLDILNQHVHSLLDVNAFSIYLMQPDGKEMRTALLVEGGKNLPPFNTRLDSPTSNIARSVRERREILIDRAPEEVDPGQVPGTMQNLSALYAPLAIGERVLGAMTIQSTQRHAYGEREQLVFRTLCAYGAIALDNADAYARLQSTLDTLRQTESKLLLEEQKARQHARELAEANSRLKHNARELHLAKQKAEQATRLKSEFLANMSHEIRTPMNAVIGLAHLALRTELTHKQQDYLSKIHHAGLSLLGILNDILDFSKIEAGKLHIERISFNLDEVLRHVANVTGQKAAEKRLEYLFQVPPGLPRQLIGDPLRLGQILVNLVNNAIKFSEAGEVELSCSGPISGDLPPASPITLQFAVRDTGIGMNAEQCQRLFQSFQQADGSTTRKYGGTGLGLAISQHLVQLMGGVIEVDSQPGRGSRFHFRLGFELAAPAATVPAPPRQPLLPPELDQARALILEPHPVARSILLSSLKAHGLRVSAVANAEQAGMALASAEAANAPYALLFASNGPEIAQFVRRALACLTHAPRLILCAPSGQEDERVASTLHKPLILSQLRQLLANNRANEQANNRANAQANESANPLANDSGNQAANQASNHSANPPAPRSAASPPNRPGVRILVAEDNDINQQIALELLTSLGVEVDIASDGQLALDKLQAAGPHAYQLIFMDLEMPEMDGHNATLLIRQEAQFDAIPIIAMTAHAQPEIEQRCLAEGMQDYLTKPINPDLLADALARWLPAPGPA
jgi:signal transduction histidine kinase/CheY-like chemotaxis protein